MDFQPVTKKRLSESVVENIKEFIEKNNLEVGSKLPPEQELSKRFQVGKASIREALRMLEITGVVAVKPGKGIYVNAITGDLVVPLSTCVSTKKDTILKHFEARLIIEPEIAALAARRISPEDIRIIEQNIEIQQSFSESEIAAIIRTDIEFHGLIAESAKNETLTMLFNSIARISFHGWKAALRVKGRNQSAVREHKKLLKMLIQKDENGVRTTMRNHMLHSIRLIKQESTDFMET
jgi:GntR family transcriptional repressor for pyruvate dehydrogenase complex